MKFKSMFLVGILFFTLLGASVTSAGTIQTENYTFNIPDDYTVLENGSVLSMYNDVDCIIMYQGKVLDTSKVREKRDKRGLDVDEKNFTFEGVNINQQKFSENGFNNAVYTFDKNGKSYIISYVINETKPVPEFDNSTVANIIHTLT